MSQASIQVLFARLRREHFDAYLTETGWRPAKPRAADATFEYGADDDPFLIKLPESDASPRRRLLLQRAVYCLCEVEDRQPAEIIHALLEAVPGE